jgi:AcrR family transcriptional regulator
VPKISAPTVAEHRSVTYGALLDATAALIAERGYDEVSMADIARRAGVARTAIYNYAPDKSSLLIAAATRDALEVKTAIDEVLRIDGMDSSARLGAVVRMLLLNLTASTERLLAVRALRVHLDQEQTEQAMSPVRLAFGAQLATIIDAGIADGSFTPHGDVELTITLVVGAFEAALDRVIVDPAAAEAIANTTVAFIRRALGAHA